MNILADSSLPDLDWLFPKPCHLTTYQNKHELLHALPHHDVLLCRSTLQVTPELLAKSTITCVATASSGVDHIDTDCLHKHQIQLFDAKGCNAEAVSDYVLSTIAYLDTHQKLPGMRVGIMGAGQVGSRVSTCLKSLGFEVFLYDPPKENTTPDFISCTLADFSTCDVLCIHANLHNTPPHPTKNFLDADFIKKLKKNTVIINAARGGILDEQALLNASKSFVYCTDVYQEEPNICFDIINYATLCTPHIAGHSIEAKRDAVFHISQVLHQYFNLPAPSPKTYPKQRINKLPNTWQTRALTLYNPIHETMDFKKANNKSTAFLNLRRAHQLRHNFSHYEKE